MIVPNNNYRPNPFRAIYVNGNIDQHLVYRLTPQIVQFQSQDRTPITVYIDSDGGSIQNMQGLWRLLTASNQDAAPACLIITVVTSKAASAAADLLSSGDYAIAMPHSKILYHGSRTIRETPLTVEATSMLAYLLRRTNETYAMELIRKIESRFMFLFLLSRQFFGPIREKNAPKLMTDTECFLFHISNSLSEGAQKLLKAATDRHGRYDKLLKAAPKASKRKRVAKIDADRLKAIIDFEVEDNKDNKNWTFQGIGLTRLTDDFFLLNEHLAISESDRLNRLCDQWGKFSLSKEEREEIDRAPETERSARLIQKVRPQLEPLWAFFVALCHALQEGENELTAMDAYWLGLIDEVIGESKLPSFRVMMEYQEDPPKPEPTKALPETTEETKTIGKEIDKK